MISAPAGSRKTCEPTPDSIQQDVVRSRELPPHWVRNVRASGEVSLTRSQHTARYRAEEVTGTGAVPVLRTYIRKVRVTRPYFDATGDSSDGELLAEIPRHPVFRLTRES
jgi:hypothetical protein